MGVFFYFKGLVNYNWGMDKKDYYTNCEKCGRPQTYAKPCSCGCPFGTGEYRMNVKGCIRNKDPECPYNAVIASVTLETVDGIKNLADCFVHVTSNNTTFYIDDKHRIMTIWAGPVEIEEYDYENNPLGLKSQFCFTTVNDAYTEIYFDKQGVAHIIGKEEV